jgi:hypothetical protein
MPRPCSVCGHAERDAIDLALVSGEPARRVGVRWSVSRSAVTRHFGSHVRPGVARVQAVVRNQTVQENQHDVDVMAEVQRVMARVQLLFDACDRWLRDPDDSTRYELGPRDHDVQVIYREVGSNGRPIQKKAPLSRLLTMLKDAGVDVERSEWRHADPRELVLKTADRLQSNLELLAKLLGELDDRPQINLLVAPEWHKVRAALLDALLLFPDARTAVVTRLKGLEAA